MSETNWPRPWRCRSSSLRSSDAPTPYWSLGIGRLLADFLRRLGDGGDDVRITGAAANVAGEAVANFAFGTGAPAPDQIARGDQHRRRAEPALQSVMLMKVAAQHCHHGIASEAFYGLNRARVAGDGEH